MINRVVISHCGMHPSISDILDIKVYDILQLLRFLPHLIPGSKEGYTIGQIFNALAMSFPVWELQDDGITEHTWMAWRGYSIAVYRKKV